MVVVMVEKVVISKNGQEFLECARVYACEDGRRGKEVLQRLWKNVHLSSEGVPCVSFHTKMVGGSLLSIVKQYTSLPELWPATMAALEMTREFRNFSFRATLLDTTLAPPSDSSAIH